MRLWNPPPAGRWASSCQLDTGPGGSGNGLAFSPDGRLLATADGNGTVRLRDPATGRAVGSPLQADTGPGGSVNAVAFSPDGRLLATADGNGTAQLWNIGFSPMP